MKRFLQQHYMADDASPCFTSLPSFPPPSPQLCSGTHVAPRAGAVGLPVHRPHRTLHADEEQLRHHAAVAEQVSAQLRRCSSTEHHTKMAMPPSQPARAQLCPPFHARSESLLRLPTPSTTSVGTTARLSHCSNGHYITDGGATAEDVDFYRSTFIFNVFVWCTVLNEFNSRSLDDSWNVLRGLHRDRAFIGVILVSVVLQVSVVPEEEAVVRCSQMCAMSARQWQCFRCQRSAADGQLSARQWQRLLRLPPDCDQSSACCAAAIYPPHRSTLPAARAFRSSWHPPLQVIISEFGGSFTKTTGLTPLHWVYTALIALITIPLGIAMRFIPVPDRPADFADYFANSFAQRMATELARSPAAAALLPILGGQGKHTVSVKVPSAPAPAPAPSGAGVGEEVAALRLGRISAHVVPAAFAVPPASPAGGDDSPAATNPIVATPSPVPVAPGGVAVTA